MACIIHLTPNGGDTNGNWYLTSAPGGYDGNMETGLTAGTLAANSPALLANGTVKVAAQAGAGDDVYVRLETEAVGTYIFTYVTPEPNDASNCADDCVDCAEFTITAEAVEPDSSDTYCDSDVTTYNVFTILTLDPLEWTIDAITGCTIGDPDCIASNGNFVPADMGVGTYVVTLLRVNALDGCDDCDVNYTINIDLQGDAGNAQNGVVCV